MSKNNQDTKGIQMSKDDNSPQVIAYRVSQLEKTVADGFATLHAKLDILRDGFVTHEQFNTCQQMNKGIHEELEKRLTKLENWQTWLIRLVVGAVVMSILALVLGDKVLS